MICALTDEGERAIVQFWRISKERKQMVTDMMTDDQLLAAITGMETIGDAEVEIQPAIMAVSTDPAPAGQTPTETDP